MLAGLVGALLLSTAGPVTQTVACPEPHEGAFRAETSYSKESSLVPYGQLVVPELVGQAVHPFDRLFLPSVDRLLARQLLKRRELPLPARGPAAVPDAGMLAHRAQGPPSRC